MLLTDNKVGPTSEFAIPNYKLHVMNYGFSEGVLESRIWILGHRVHCSLGDLDAQRRFFAEEYKSLAEDGPGEDCKAWWIGRAKREEIAVEPQEGAEAETPNAANKPALGLWGLRTDAEPVGIDHVKRTMLRFASPDPEQQFDGPVPSDEYMPAFTPIAEQLRAQSHEVLVVKDAGDIPADVKYSYRVPCSVKHPGICKTRDKGHVTKLKSLASKLFDCFDRGRFYKVASTYAEERLGELCFRVSHKRDRDPKMICMVRANESPLIKTLNLELKDGMLCKFTGGHLARLLWPVHLRKAAIAISYAQYEHRATAGNYLQATNLGLSEWKTVDLSSMAPAGGTKAEPKEGTDTADPILLAKEQLFTDAFNAMQRMSKAMTEPHVAPWPKGRHFGPHSNVTLTRPMRQGPWCMGPSALDQVS